MLRFTKKEVTSQINNSFSKENKYNLFQIYNNLKFGEFDKIEVLHENIHWSISIKDSVVRETLSENNKTIFSSDKMLSNFRSLGIKDYYLHKSNSKADVIITYILEVLNG